MKDIIWITLGFIIIILMLGVYKHGIIYSAISGTLTGAWLGGTYILINWKNNKIK